MICQDPAFLSPSVPNDIRRLPCCAMSEGHSIIRILLLKAFSVPVNKVLLEPCLKKKKKVGGDVVT